MALTFVHRSASLPRLGAAFLFVLLRVIEQSHAYSSGAPSAACFSMTPSHPRSPQSTTSPYAVYVSARQYAPGGQLTVTINGTQQFKGFLLIARTSSSSSAVGTFTVTPVSQAVCGGGLTHTTNTPLNSLSAQWTTPATAQGSVNMYATVVQSESVYWMALSSALVWDGQSSTASTTAASVPGGTAMFLSKGGAGCGVTASCFSSPSGFAGSDCSYLLVWRPLLAVAGGRSSSSGLLQFQLQAQKTATFGYVSVGFGQSKTMKNLSIVNCVSTSVGEKVTQTYSIRYEEPSVVSGVNNLQNVSAVSSADFIQCSFVWNNNARTSDQQPDLTASQYLVMARGQAVGNAAGNILQHIEYPVSLVDRIVIASTEYAHYPILTSSTKNPSTGGGTRDLAILFNMAIKSGSSSLSDHFTVKYLLGLLLCVSALAA